MSEHEEYRSLFLDRDEVIIIMKKPHVNDSIVVADLRLPQDLHLPQDHHLPKEQKNNIPIYSNIKGK
jgi:hypothetical protein